MRSVLPNVTKPMLATLVDAPFDDPAWLFETKWDGVRALCGIEGAKVTLTSRNGKDLLVNFPEMRSLSKTLSGTPALFDGELVSFDKGGRSSFQRLQSRINLMPGARSARLVSTVYVVFDVLYAHGKDLRREPLDARKRILKSVIVSRTAHIRCSVHVVGKGRKAFARAQSKGLEGVIGKRRESTYQERRSTDWVKIKVVHEQEFVIGGWTEPRGSRTRFGALLVGVFDKDKFIYVGGVGTGFDRALLDAVMKRLKPLETSKCPFAAKPPVKANWVRPRLVCEVKFAEWTTDGIMRQPVFLGLRADKPAKSVVRERPKHLINAR